MPEFKKGQSGNRRGRPKGAVNKSTKEIKEAFQMLLEQNLPHLNKWLQEVASEDPEKALSLVLRLSEYIIPKLARQEMTGKDGEDLFKDIQFRFGKDK
jgi:hypothetical protein